MLMFINSYTYIENDKDSIDNPVFFPRNIHYKQ